MNSEPVVFLICDKSKARRQVAARLRQLGYGTEAFKSMEEFRERPFTPDAGCLVLFLADPDGDLDWLRSAGPGHPLAGQGHWPVVAVAAEADVETAVAAMKNGAFDFLLESCTDRRLSGAINEAFAHDAVCRRRIAEVQSAARRMEKLAPTLREVLDLLLLGRTNREIADELKLSERAIEDRRARIMRTMKVHTVVALVRQALLAEGVTARRGCESTHVQDNDAAMKHGDGRAFAETVFSAHFAVLRKLCRVETFTRRRPRGTRLRVAGKTSASAPIDGAIPPARSPAQARSVRPTATRRFPRRRRTGAGGRRANLPAPAQQHDGAGDRGEKSGYACQWRTPGRR